MKKLLIIFSILAMTAFAKTTITLNEKNTINFNNSFTDEFVAQKQIEAIKLCNTAPGSDIYVILNTPGGSVSAGALLFDTLNALSCKFHTITIFSASMGYQTVQQLGKRYMLSSSVLMSHRASIGGLRGEIGGELDSFLKYITDGITEMELVASNRVGITLKDYRSLISDELWLTGTEAVKTNHADEIIDVVCDSSLLGTSIKRMSTMFGAFDVEFSDCPIITGILSVQISKKGQKISDAIDFFTNKRKYINKNIEL